MICGGGDTHELVRDDHVLCVCGSSLHASSSLLTIYGLTNDTVLIMISYPVGVQFFYPFFLNHHTRAYFKLRWIWQVMWILEQSMVARLCDKYHNIVLARLQLR